MKLQQIQVGASNITPNPLRAQSISPESTKSTRHHKEPHERNQNDY